MATSEVAKVPSEVATVPHGEPNHRVARADAGSTRHPRRTDPRKCWRSMSTIGYARPPRLAASANPRMADWSSFGLQVKEQKACRAGAGAPSRMLRIIDGVTHDVSGLRVGIDTAIAGAEDLHGATGCLSSQQQ